MCELHIIAKTCLFFVSMNDPFDAFASRGAFEFKQLANCARVLVPSSGLRVLIPCLFAWPTWWSRLIVGRNCRRPAMFCYMLGRARSSALIVWLVCAAGARVASRPRALQADVV